MTSLRPTRPLRSLVVGITAALLGLPAAATASAPASPDSAATKAVAAKRYNTSIRFLDFDHTRGFGTKVGVRGQVKATVGRSTGAVQGVRVKLYRQIKGTSSWRFLAADLTSRRARPAFRFTVRAKANANYRVAFVGNRKLQRSAGVTSVSVYRLFHASLESGSGRFHGRVTPAYRGKRISLQKRACASCGWKTTRSQQTTKRGGYAFKVGAPAHGRSRWRVRTPASAKFITSYSPVFSTRRA